jgi:hypothetical protein
MQFPVALQRGEKAVIDTPVFFAEKTLIIFNFRTLVSGKADGDRMLSSRRKNSFWDLRRAVERSCQNLGSNRRAE